MNFVPRFVAEVEEDVISGYLWYETKSLGLGEEFLRVFYACVSDIPRNPYMYPKVHRDFRRCLLRRFPYAIYFTLSGEEVIVFGLFHCARDPRAVRNALGDRHKLEGQ